MLRDRLVESIATNLNFTGKVEHLSSFNMIGNTIWGKNGDRHRLVTLKAAHSIGDSLLYQQYGIVQ